MTNRLDPILAAKRDHVAACKRRCSLADLDRQMREAPPPRGFSAALQARRDAGRYGLIAEIKRASPSKGLIRLDFDPPALARAYRAGGAACLSVLTDTPYFQGHDNDLTAVRDAIDLPLLRKDFMIDPYQIAEARVLGADCILLIMAALSDSQAQDLYDAASHYGLDALVEVHDAAELARALLLTPTIIGINNRNLKTLQVEIATSLDLASHIPDPIIKISESGLSIPGDLAVLAQSGITNFLIGEALLRHSDVETATRNLLVDRP